jgi:hypothetical protein
MDTIPAACNYDRITAHEKHCIAVALQLLNDNCGPLATDISEARAAEALATYIIESRG